MSKPLHGQYPLRSQKADIDLHDTHQWLRSTGLKTRIQGFIVAAQDQGLFTRNFQANILHNGANPRCRFCNASTKTIDPTSSHGALFLPQMSIQTGIIVLGIIYTGKSVTTIILKHPANGMSTNRYLLWIPQRWPFSEISLLVLTEQYKLTGQI